MKLCTYSIKPTAIRSWFAYFALTISCIGYATAQSQFNQLLSSDKGLSSTLIGDVMQDRNGNLWIATENGLNKYNGVKLRNYFHDISDPPFFSARQHNGISVPRRPL